MIKKVLQSLLAALCLVAVTGCIMPKGYIDPAFRLATYRDVNAEAVPTHAKIETRFSMNGKDVARATDVLTKKINRVLQSTKVFEPDAHASSVLSIHVDNFGDKGEAFTKGFATGFTFGLVGSHVVDHYKMTISYHYGENQVFENSYEHALHSTIGLKSAPAGMEPVTYADAFDQIAEDMLLRFLVDFQKWEAVEANKQKHAT